MYSGGPAPQAYVQSMQQAKRAQEATLPVDPNKPVPECANKTGGVETDDGRTLFGLDAEIYLKIKAKEDPDWERKIGVWVQTVWGKPLIDVADLHTSLKDGVILCEILNILKPGTVKKINPTTGMLKHLAERDNIQLYLKGCYTLGIDNSSMFTIADLHARRGIANVLSNIAALSQLASQRLGCKVDPLGPAIVSSESKVEHSQRTFKWAVDTSHLTKVMAGEAISEGQSDLENTLKELRAKLEVQSDKILMLERDRNLLAKTIEREKMKARDSDQHANHLRSNAPPLAEYFSILESKKSTLSTQLEALNEQANSEALLLKLMDILNDLEKTFDQEEEDHRNAMAELTAHFDELNEKASYMYATIQDSDPTRSELSSQITTATSKLSEETALVQYLESKLNDDTLRFLEEQKSLKQQYDGLMSRQQSLLSEMESVKNKMKADLEALSVVHESKKNTILEKIQDLNHKKKTFTDRTQEERDNILKDLHASMNDGKLKLTSLENQKSELEKEKQSSIATLAAAIEQLEEQKAAKTQSRDNRINEVQKELEALKAHCVSEEQKVIDQLKQAQESLKKELQNQQSELQNLTDQLNELNLAHKMKRINYKLR